MREIRRTTVRATVCAALLAGWAATASADDGISTTISGYGTLGGTFTSNNQYAYHHDPTEFVGANEQLDVGLESRLGVQAVIDFGSGFSVTAQELIRERDASEFSIGTEWLYLQYSTDFDLKARVGRVVVGSFLESESRNVGYAQPWFRAPNDVYATQTVQAMNGAQLLWSHSVGLFAFGLEAAFGNSKEDYDSETTGISTLNIKNMYNLAASVEYQSFLVRVAQTTFRIPTSVALSPTFTDNFQLLDVFRSVGVQYDDGKAIVLGEFARRTDSEVPIVGLPAADQKMWYVAAGWRFGKLTPMLIHGNYESGDSLFNPKGNFSSWSGSLRYDVVRNIALKAQVSRTPAGNETYWVTPNLADHSKVNVYSLGADFVF